MTDTKCLICDYSLAGLPRKHTCPECGAAYTDDSPQWTRTPTSLLGFINAAGLAIPTITVLIVIGNLVGGRGTFLSPIIALFVLATLVYTVLKKRRSRARGITVTILPDHFVYQKFDEREIVALDDIESLKRVENHLLLKRRGVRQAIRIEALFVNSLEAVKAVRAFNEFLEKRSASKGLHVD